MRCDTCAGTGRVRARNFFGQGDSHVWLTEIGPCPDCLNGEVSCCEGASREQALVTVGELIDGAAVEVNFEVNPNEA